MPGGGCEHEAILSTIVHINNTCVSMWKWYCVPQDTSPVMECAELDIAAEIIDNNFDCTIRECLILISWTYEISV